MLGVMDVKKVSRDNSGLAAAIINETKEVRVG